MIKTLLAGAAITLALTATAFAETLNIGFLITLSGPIAPIGQHARDGFLLAVEQRGGRLGGLETEVIVEDDNLKPELAVGHAQKFIESDKVHFVVGMISSNILQAVFHQIAESETFMIGVNAGTSIYAGSKCSPFFFSTSSENNQVPETMGKHAQYRLQTGRDVDPPTTRLAATPSKAFGGSIGVRCWTRSTCCLANSTLRPSYRKYGH